jgi:2-C-methyl-D-erythritol 4-phosphate cytidylyltransferase
VNVALIFAGGMGQRMNARAVPKQFLEIHSKPIIIYTLELFQSHPEIDQIAVVCVGSHLDVLRQLCRKYEIGKCGIIVPGGGTGFESICKGLESLLGICAPDDLVLVHDGVRPLVAESDISLNIACAKMHGNAITCSPLTEGVAHIDGDGVIQSIPNRNTLAITKAPQTFRYSLISEMARRARADGISPVECAHLCSLYHEKLYTVPGQSDNIKVTTPRDFYTLKALLDARENEQVTG